MKLRKNNPQSVARKGKKQTYFVLPENIEKLKQIKQITKKGYSETINKLIEQKYIEIFKETKND